MPKKNGRRYERGAQRGQRDFSANCHDDEVRRCQLPGGGQARARQARARQARARQARARQIERTINGIGERAGTAS